MRRWAIVAQLKPGTADRAAELIAQGPPYDLADEGVIRQSVYLSAKEAVFVFEGEQSESRLERLTEELRDLAGRRSEDWGAIVEDAPRVAHEQFRREVDKTELDRLRHVG